jgi:putative copper export protein
MIMDPIDAGAMAGPMADRALCDAPLLGALLMVFGLAFFMLKIAPAQTALDSPRPAFWTLMRLFAALQLALCPVKLLISAASMAGVTLRQAFPLIPEVVRETHFGHDWLVSAPLAVALAVIVWIPGRRGAGRARLSVVLSALLLVGWALSSHAIDFGPFAVAVYALHEAAAGLWAGSLVGLWLVARRASLGDGVELTAARVSRLSAWCVLVLLISGTYGAFNTVGLSLSHLLDSAYGQILISKLLLAALIVGLGGYNRYRLVPAVATVSARTAMLRNVAVECVLLIAVLGLAALLANTPPAH